MGADSGESRDGRMKPEEPFEVRYESPLDAGGWTIVYHRITSDHRISDGALRLYLLLHRYAQQKGEAWPSRRTLAREMGVSEATIKRRLRELSAVGLIERRRESFGGAYTTYLLNPNGRYLQGLQGQGDGGGGEEETSDSIRVKNDPYDSIRVKNDPSYGSNLTRHEEITIEEKEEEEKGREEAEIAKTLTENGVFPEVAREIAVAIAAAGLTAEDALAIWMATVRSIQTGPPRGDEEVIALAVDRLKRGIWDGGETARGAVRRARYGAPGGPAAPDQARSSVPAGEEQSSPAPPSPPPPPPAPDPSVQTLVGGRSWTAERVWQAALGELQLETTQATFNTLLRPARLAAYDDGAFTVAVVNEYAKDWLESRLRTVVLRILTRLTGRTVEVRFVTEAEWAEQKSNVEVA